MGKLLKSPLYNNRLKLKPHILPIIIIAQFFCTSPWFAGNTIIDELIAKTGLGLEIVGYIISSVQFGFIIGTLVFAILMLADRFSPAKVFMICAFLAALCNGYLLTDYITKWSLLLARFGTGFFLAGIYPVGMKIAADYYEKGLGKALGFLVGALVLGTALPFIINGTIWGGNPETVIIITSSLTFLGGLLLYALVPNGPFRKKNIHLNLNAGPLLFKNFKFRKAAFGYFGHMWELYAFWAFTPIAITGYNIQTSSEISVPFWTGIIIALGGISCAIGGILSQKIGSIKVALGSLTLSGLLCFISPLLFTLPQSLFLTGWCIWGIAVTADSPQLSKLVATSVNPELKGTALTFATCIGFGITILSIQLLSVLQNIIKINYVFLLLSIGPLLGVWQLIYLKND